MAKRKKIKKQASQPIQPATVRANKGGEQGAAIPPREDTVRVAAPSSRQPSLEDSPRKSKEIKTVRFTTCVAGMFLTLVLGIYIGTLFPNFFETSGQPGTSEAPAAAGPAQAAQSDTVQASLMHSIAEAEKKAAAHIDSAPDWVHLGNLYFDAQMPEKAIQAYEHSLSLAPNNADVLTDLGIMYREVGQFEKAVECFRKAIAIEPGHQNAMFNEGVVLSTDLHKKEEAIAAWERLLEFNPNARAFDGRAITDMIKQLR